jgi:hypothetical protein
MVPERPPVREIMLDWELDHLCLNLNVGSPHHRDHASILFMGRGDWDWNLDQLLIVPLLSG